MVDDTMSRTEAIDRLVQLAAQGVGATDGRLWLTADGAEGPLEELCAATLERGEPLVRGDAPGVGAFLGAPVSAAGELVGVLAVHGPTRRAWSGQDVAVVRAIGEAVGTELELGGVAAEAAETAVRLDLGFAAANIGSYDWNLVTNELRWDERLIELFGYDAASFVPHIDTFTARVHPDDVSRVDAAVEAAVTQCGDFASEYRIVLPDNEQRWIAARGRVLCGPDGKAERLLGAAYDATAAYDARERVARVLETMSSAFYSVDREWRFTYVNAEAEKLLGRSRHELLGRVIWDEFPEASQLSFGRLYPQAMETGEPVTFEEFYPPRDGWYELRAWPSADGLSVFFHEITERVAAQEGRRRAVERLERLSEAGSRLTTLDVRDLLATLEDLLVPRYAGWVAVALHDDVSALLDERESRGQTTLRVVHVGGGEPAVAALLDLEAGSAEGDDAGRTVGEHVRRALRSAGALDAATELRTIELEVRGRALGVLVVGRPAGDDADQRLVDDIAQRAATALENAVLYAAERHAGSTLQHLLLPTALPQLDRITTATRYIAGTAGRLVGGDFYLGHVLDDGRLLLVIGDVMGHGMEAAARMGQLRAVLTAYAFDGDPPDRVLGRVASRAEDLLDVQMATVLVCVYDPTVRRLTAASAGHLPPLLAPLDAPPRFVDVPPGPPIGVGAAEYPSVTVDVPHGSTIVLYTDGLVERRGEDLDAGLERLRGVLKDVKLPPELVADHVLDRLGRAAGAPDDVALVVFSHL